MDQAKIKEKVSFHEKEKCKDTKAWYVPMPSFSQCNSTVLDWLWFIIPIAGQKPKNFLHCTRFLPPTTGKFIQG